VTKSSDTVDDAINRTVDGGTTSPSGELRAGRTRNGVRPFRDVWPRIHRTVWLAPGSIVVGDVEIGEDSSVWYGCVLRGDVEKIRVGARSNVQDGSVLHVTKGRFECTVGDEVTIGHRAVVHGCVVGDGALIGIGAIVLDGATVGAGALIGAGSVVTPGSVISPHTVAMGTPAREIRRLSDTERDAQRERTLHYVETARLHAAADGA
jgi:carbonic anhydrase/acetyltransferase-like protein (isoleucine patch superfamily)